MKYLLSFLLLSSFGVYASGGQESKIIKLEALEECMNLEKSREQWRCYRDMAENLSHQELVDAIGERAKEINSIAKEISLLPKELILIKGAVNFENLKVIEEIESKYFNNLNALRDLKDIDQGKVRAVSTTFYQGLRAKIQGLTLISQTAKSKVLKIKKLFEGITWIDNTSIAETEKKLKASKSNLTAGYQASAPNIGKAEDNIFVYGTPAVVTLDGNPSVEETGGDTCIHTEVTLLNSAPEQDSAAYKDGKKEDQKYHLYQCSSPQGAKVNIDFCYLLESPFKKMMDAYNNGEASLPVYQRCGTILPVYGKPVASILGKFISYPRAAVNNEVQVVNVAVTSDGGKSTSIEDSSCEAFDIDTREQKDVYSQNGLSGNYYNVHALSFGGYTKFFYCDPIPNNNPNTNRVSNPNQCYFGSDNSENYRRFPCGLIKLVRSSKVIANVVVEWVEVLREGLNFMGRFFDPKAASYFAADGGRKVLPQLKTEIKLENGTVSEIDRNIERDRHFLPVSTHLEEYTALVEYVSEHTRTLLKELCNGGVTHQQTIGNYKNVTRCKITHDFPAKIKINGKEYNTVTFFVYIQPTLDADGKPILDSTGNPVPRTTIGDDINAVIWDAPAFE